jgi:hypothetical protein
VTVAFQKRLVILQKDRHEVLSDFLYFTDVSMRNIAALSSRQPDKPTIRRFKTMLKKTLIAFILPLVVFLSPCDTSSANSIAHRSTSNAQGPTLNGGQSQNGATGVLQKMIVESGTATMELDLNRLNGISSLTPKFEAWRFDIAANSFFSILVFNDLLRGPEQGSMALMPAGASAFAEPTAGQAAPSYSNLPATFNASLKQLAIEKLPSSEQFDLAVRDAITRFTFFNIEGQQYNYDAGAQLLTVNGGRLTMSRDFANALGRPSDAGAVVGEISLGAAMQPVEIKELVNGELKEVTMPPLRSAPNAEAPTAAHGPDVIVGDLPNLQQFGSAGTRVGLAVATTSCNNGDQPLDWLQLPQTDHPVIPQNLYRMRGGIDNTERFEQVGQSWLKHAFFALEDDACSFGCNTNGCATGSHLCPGCSDPYSAGLNGDQDQIGSRAWVNPFTGNFPSTANDHSGHNHDGVSHRILVEVDDLNTTMNQGATYFVEAQYATPHEYAWCQAHPGECNMFNNASYRKFLVSGTTNFSFSPDGPTTRMQPAIRAWTGATVNRIEPDPGNDGIWFIGYKVTNPSAGVWHYEYALYNQNLDRAIQSFSVPLGATVNVSNIGFHAPPQQPGFAHDGTQGDAGFSSTPWTATQSSNSLTWNCETFAQNQNANAIRWGTLYNFRFDADQPPQATNATVDFFKTGAPMTVAIQAPAGGGTPTPTPTATPSATPRPTPTPRPGPIPRSRPTPVPRPSS